MMNFAAIYHRTSDNLSYALNNEELIINIKTGYDVVKVELYYNDPFSGGILGGAWQWKGIVEEIVDVKELQHHLWWSIKVKPEFKRIKYYFKITFNNEEEYYYTEGGFLKLDQINDPCYAHQMFTNPWLNSSDVNYTPSWVNNTIWYQIFPDRFYNLDNQITGNKKWHHGPVKNEHIYGGNLKGITSKLDYLQELGINGIYLTPIFKANTVHKYDTSNYLEVDEAFGTNEDLTNLVKKAHQSNIRVMLDAVFNHTGTMFFAWQD
ncbi:MAG: alpha amylase N-terminal ig-like domain-containing protein, partial [Bacilli bacterium]